MLSVKINCNCDSIVCPVRVTLAKLNNFQNQSKGGIAGYLGDIVSEPMVQIL